MFQNPLAAALGSSLMPTHPEAQPLPKLGKGQIIAGILADMLAGARGQPGQFAQQLAHRQAQQDEEVNWGRRRKAELEDYEKKQQIEQRYAGPSPMVRDAEAWQRMTPEQKAAYQEVQGFKQGDPDVFVTLPNGQVYAGPKSGLAQALMGGGSVPQRPVGKLTPLGGGPTPQASGGFPGY